MIYKCKRCGQSSIFKHERHICDKGFFVPFDEADCIPITIPQNPGDTSSSSDSSDSFQGGGGESGGGGASSDF